MTHKEYSFLWGGSSMYAIHENSNMYVPLLGMAQKRPPSEEVLWQIFAELRTRLANPKTKRFYEDLRRLFPDEYRHPISEGYD